MEEQKVKYRSFKASYQNVIFLTICAIPFAVHLFRYGTKNIPLFPVMPSMQFIFGYLPMSFSVIMVIGVIYLFFYIKKLKIGINPYTFEYNDLFTENYATKWEDLNYFKIDKAGGFKYMLLSDGKKSFRLSNFFFAKFSSITTIIEAAINSSKKKGIEI